jgi:hypothetical protein
LYEIDAPRAGFITEVFVALERGVDWSREVAYAAAPAQVFFVDLSPRALLGRSRRRLGVVGGGCGHHGVREVADELREDGAIAVKRKT